LGNRLAPRKLARRLAGIASDRRGSVAVTATLLAPILLMVMAGAITLAQLMGDRSSLQDQLDAAVLAGAGDPGDDAARIATASRYFNGNGHASPATSGTTASFSVQGDIVYGVADTTGSTPFSGILGHNGFQVRVTSAARRRSIPLCLLGLDASASGALDAQGSPSINAPNCAVQVNSASARGITQQGHAPQRALWFGVSGGADVHAFSPAPVAGAPAIADPLAQTPFPSFQPCAAGAGALSIKQDATLSPGTYCGGIDISGGRVMFQPGVYVMVGGPLAIRGSASASGDQVMIAFTGPGATLEMRGASQLTLTSPTSGAYANIQFFENEADPSGGGASVSIGGSGGDGCRLSYDGVAYFPTQDFLAYGDVVIDANSPTLALVADKMAFRGNPTLNVTTANPRNVAMAGAAQIASGAQLIG